MRDNKPKPEDRLWDGNLGALPPERYLNQLFLALIFLLSAQKPAGAWGWVLGTGSASVTARKRHRRSRNTKLGRIPRPAEQMGGAWIPIPPRLQLHGNYPPAK